MTQKELTKSKAKGWNIEVTETQFEYLCEVLMEANGLDIAEQKEWDVQTLDNLIDNVCDAKETYLTKGTKGI